MTPEWLSTAAAVVSALASSIGLSAIWRTLQNSREQNKNTIYQMVTTRMSAIEQIFLQMPELRPYFYDTKDHSQLQSQDPLLHSRVQAMCEMLIDHAEVVLERPKVMGALGESYARYFRSLLKTSPALRGYWAEKKDWYIQPLHDFFGERNDISEIRAWAEANGYKLSLRGQIKKEIIDAYDEAQGLVPGVWMP